MIKIKIKKKLISTDIKPFYLDIDLQIKNNQFITIFGKSGNGKTTILRTIAGLEKADEGFIQVVDEVWLDTKKGINLPPQKRKIGFLFQDYALFPNMNVEENIKFTMEKEDKNLLEEFLEILDIKKEDIVYVITILVGNDILKVVATEEEIKGLKVGDLVLLSVKAFSPIIIKV